MFTTVLSGIYNNTVSGIYYENITITIRLTDKRQVDWSYVNKSKKKEKKKDTVISQVINCFKPSQTIKPCKLQSGDWLNLNVYWSVSWRKHFRQFYTMYFNKCANTITSNVWLVHTQCTYHQYWANNILITVRTLNLFVLS